MKISAAAMAGMLVMLAAGNAFSLQINDRPGEVTLTTNGLQNLFDSAILAGRPNAATDQSDVANWGLADSNSSYTYLVSLAAGGTASSFGIYSAKTGAEYVLLSSSRRSRGFSVSDTGALSISDDPVDEEFGKIFGFYFLLNSTSSKVYTEDEDNGGEINSLAYNLPDGTIFKTGYNIGTAYGGDDWIMAFRSSTTGDFTDGVYFVKDLSPVPEPGTMMLFGAGFLGLAIYSKRRKNIG